MAKYVLLNLTTNKVTRFKTLRAIKIAAKKSRSDVAVLNSDGELYARKVNGAIVPGPCYHKFASCSTKPKCLSKRQPKVSMFVGIMITF